MTVFRKRHAAYFVDHDKVAAILHRVNATRGACAKAERSRWSLLVGRYSDQKEMLNPLLPQIVRPLAYLLLDLAKPAVRGEAVDWEAAKGVATLLWIVCTVRGAKFVTTFFPSETEGLEPVTCLLLDAQLQAAQEGGSEGADSLQALQCTLLWWLTVLVLAPCDIVLMPTVRVNLLPSPRGCQASLQQQLLTLCTSYLASPSSVRPAAAVLLGRLLTRAELATELKKFCQSSYAVVAPWSQEGGYSLLGTLAAFATIAKLSTRGELSVVASQLWTSSALLLDHKLGPASSAHVRTLAMKVARRACISNFIPHCLSNSHDGKAMGGRSVKHPDSEADLHSTPDSRVESLTVALIASLKDDHTMVRWSAAKGLAQLTSHLHQEAAASVIQSLLVLFGKDEEDTAWHGGCLAIAELVRQRMLHSRYLDSLYDVLLKALMYDIRRGSHSVGMHVRDAASYICWAVARTHTGQCLEKFVHIALPALIATGCYDREVNCRRAAAAAVQECIGRMGCYDHGTDVLAAFNFFTLSCRAQAYYVVAPAVGVYEDFSACLLELLLYSRLRHWDYEIRILSALALAALVPITPYSFKRSVVPELCVMCLHSQLEVRHGSVLALSEVLLALAQSGAPLDLADQLAVANVIPAVCRQKLVVGRGIHLLQRALYRLAECIALLRFAISKSQRLVMLQLVEQGLRSADLDVQTASQAALHAFCKAYFVDPAFGGLWLRPAYYLNGLKQADVCTACASAMALGSLPWVALQANVQEICWALIACMKQVQSSAPELQVRAVKAMAFLTEGIIVHKSTVAPGIVHCVIHQTTNTLVAAMSNYTCDHRGDVGSWVRSACMKALHRVLLMLLPLSKTAAGQGALDKVQIIVNEFLRQAVERLGHLRQEAKILLRDILSQPGLAEALPGLQMLQDSVRDVPPSSQSLEQSILQFMGLLSSPCYRQPVMEGMVASLGSLDANLAKAIYAAVSKALEASNAPDANCPLLSSIGTALVEAWGHNARSSRMGTSLLRMGTLYVACIPTHATGAHAAQSNLLWKLAAGDIVQCKDTSQVAAAALFLTLLSTRTPRAVDLEAVVHMLSSKYPKVRKVAAEMLFLQISSLACQNQFNQADQNMSACEILAGARWDSRREYAVRICENLRTTYYKHFASS